MLDDFSAKYSHYFKTNFYVHHLYSCININQSIASIKNDIKFNNFSFYSNKNFRLYPHNVRNNEFNLNCKNEKMNHHQGVTNNVVTCAVSL